MIATTFSRCDSTNPNEMTEKHAHTNALINESSPYLLQHAHNPVNWYPWGEEALKKAADENKLIIISIGYSACHWCHVMERESFEDTAVAKVMNENFVCIKVDREERPDIDQVYMDAVQLMTGRGGWPLNCVALPDGKPFFGGTYFKKDQWVSVLERVVKEFNTNAEEVYEFADRLTSGVQQNELIALNAEAAEFDTSTLQTTVENWEGQFDTIEGGPNRAPKFPLPNNYLFLMRYASLFNDQDVDAHVELTLDKMARGGIYDQLGGGFARYSTDERWKVPHFEKMLYDNAQLVGLYSEAFIRYRKEDYAQVVRESLAFIDRELSDKSGAFYSALDADSEGEEGTYYIWTKEELKSLLGEDFSLFSDYFNVNSSGIWEKGQYILLRGMQEKALAQKYNLNEVDLRLKMNSLKEKLHKVRWEREKPGLDDKSLTSWNAMMISAYTEAYDALGDKEFLARAEKGAEFILNQQKKEDGGLWHSYKNGKSTINAYLEDYAHCIEAFVNLYQSTFNEKWLNEAKILADYSIEHFFSEQNKMFFFTSNEDPSLIARKMEVNDNVMPSSNSSLAKGLFYLGTYLDNEAYLRLSKGMLNNVQEYISKYGSGYSNWAILLLHQVFPFYEVAISGKELNAKVAEINQTYIPNKLLIGSTGESELPLLEYKFTEGETRIYVCVNKSCKLPVTEVAEALKQID